jgi:magnesium-transporting ATPase (P-type)
MGNVGGQISNPGSRRSLSKDATSNYLFWLTVAVIIVIILVMAYFYFRPLPKSNGVNLTADDEFIILNRLEDTILAWITVATFFITFAIIIKGFERYSIFYSIGFLVLGIILLVMVNVNYLTDRQRIAAAGFKIKPRMDVLFVIVLMATIISIIILYDIINYDVPKVKGIEMQDWQSKSHSRYDRGWFN